MIWGQFTSVESQILKESGALKDLLVFSQSLKETAPEPMVRSVKIYARGVAETEWNALSAGEDTDKTGKMFVAIISGVSELKPADDTEPSTSACLISRTRPVPTAMNGFPEREANAGNAPGVRYADRVHDSVFASLFSVP